MKYFVLLTVSLLFFSCAGDDSPPSEPTIFRKWYYKETVIDNVVHPYTDHEPCGKDYIQFYDDDKVRGVDVWDCEVDVDWEATFSLIGDQLTITDGGISRTAIITELSFDYLIYEYDLDLNADGIDEHYVEIFTAY